MEARSIIKCIICLFLTLLLTINTSVNYALEPSAPAAIGQVIWAKNSLKAQLPNDKIRTLARRSEVYEHDLLTTDSSSSGEIKFTDDSSLTLKEDSTVRIDHYSHGQGSPPSQDAFIVNVLKGGFRTITGVISKNNPGGYQANTPTATIGVMGTMYSVYFDANKGALFAKLEKGSITLSNKAGTVTLTRCSAGKKAGASTKACVNKLYAKVDNANSAPKIVAEQPTVFDSKPSSSGGVVGSFCIQ